MKMECVWTIFSILFFINICIKRKLKRQNVLTSFRKSSILENDPFQNTTRIVRKSVGMIQE